MVSIMLNSVNGCVGGVVKIDYVGLKPMKLHQNLLCARPHSIKSAPRMLRVKATKKMGMSDEECEAAVVAGNIPQAPPVSSKPAAPTGTPVLPSLPLSGRPCRNRRSPALRSAFQETTLSPANLVYPLFIHEGEENTPIGAMPGCYRLGWIHGLVEEVAKARDVGVNSIVIFPKVPDALKTSTGDEAYNENGLVPRTIRVLKDKYPDFVIYTDVALDPYSYDGHDGIVREDAVIMNDNLKTQQGVPRAPNAQPNPFGNFFYGAGSGFIKGDWVLMERKYLDLALNMCKAMQVITRDFSDPQYYFQVNDHYVKNKLNVLFPFLHRGHWTRITEPVSGRLSYNPPTPLLIYDINAPDLYILFMAFGTYVVLAGLSLGLHAKFSPGALNWLFVKGVVGWTFQVALLKMILFSLGSGEAPLLDMVAYAGYTFTGLSLAILGKIFSGYAYYFLLPWTCLCMAIFLVKTMKRVLFAEVRSYDSSRHHYLLLFIALAQFPLLIWLGNISRNWLF